MRVGEAVAELPVIVVVEPRVTGTGTDQIHQHIGTDEQQIDFSLHFTRMHNPKRLLLSSIWKHYQFETLSLSLGVKN